MIKEAVSRIYEQQLAEFASPGSPKLGRDALHDNPQISAVPWRGPPRVAPAYMLSERLVALRTQLSGSSAFVDWQDLDEERLLGRGSFATVRLFVFAFSET
jgi:hypothetical protein